jgi:uncharacterized membrane protein YbhN (UPF0104 family)
MRELLQKMMTNELAQSEGATTGRGIAPPVLQRPSRLAMYSWVVGRNILGWLLILGSWAIGLLSPIPIGFFFFLIGFGLIWFPGKRRLTARVLSGKPVPESSRVFRAGLATAAVALPTLLIVYLVRNFHLHYALTVESCGILALVYIAATGLTLFFGLPMILLFNRALAMVPPARRKAKPRLRRYGIELLPPRRMRRRSSTDATMTRHRDEEIFSIDQGQAVRGIQATVKKWGRRVIGAIITLAIFFWILRPVYKRWDQVRDHVAQTNWAYVLLASAMFAAFLFIFRVISWRTILRGLGYRLPLAPTTRIWSASELARYIPGGIWQVVGRVILVKPYGVSGTVCSTSQILELTIFLLANVLLAIGCLTWFGFKQMHARAQGWLILVVFLAPLLAALMHPKVFYGITNKILAKLGKPLVATKLRFRLLLGLLGWAMLGLLWQSMAIWLITKVPLHLQFTKWWVVAGAYCLAWCAGFLAFWAPGGLGVREAVFIAAMQVALPPRVRSEFGDPKVLEGFLAFLSVLLRLWATAGEVMLVGISSLVDRKGFLGRPDANGRVAPQAIPKLTAEPPDLRAG